MLTTQQVRNVLRANNITPRYTNKTTGHTGKVRRVKAYLPRDLSETAKFSMLHRIVESGVSLLDIKIMRPSFKGNRPSLIITCALA